MIFTMGASEADSRVSKRIGFDLDISLNKTFEELSAETVSPGIVEVNSLIDFLSHTCEKP